MRENILINIRPSLIALTLVASAAVAYEEPAETEEGPTKDTETQVSDCSAKQRRYTFSWPLSERCDWHPRGGTTTGTPITADPDVHPGWIKLQDKELSNFERDRQAILAMAGPYQASFEFLETVGYTPDFEPDRPYQSWGTEYIYVIEDRKDFISLQHIMVQDWEYQKQELLSYAGNNIWRKQKLPRKTVQGHWAQAVYQVDDSPRYESYGRWQHKLNFSTWQSERTWRPLPRREHTVRDDYQVLEGYNRHTIVPDGWVHEEENYKVQLNEQGQLRGESSYLAKEQGFNRYQRIVNFDFSAGDQYWGETQVFWRVVREEWERVIDRHKTLQLRESVDGKLLFAVMFEMAEGFRGGEESEVEVRQAVRDALERFIR